MSAARRIDLNSDVGEGFGAWAGGPDEDLMPLLTSVNIACGFHAGDPTILRRTCRLAAQYACAIGAQVSYPDLAGFGRRFIDMQPDDLVNAVIYQIGALDAFARVEGRKVRYVKPHGALYNAIVHHERQAQAVVAAVHEYDPTLAIMGLPRSAVQHACEHVGIRFVQEGFADRRYTSDGLLVPRTTPGALIVDAVDAAAQAVTLAADGVESICVHSDTPGAPALLSAVARGLAANGFGLHPFVL
jgi:UPF0271 protein